MAVDNSGKEIWKVVLLIFILIGVLGLAVTGWGIYEHLNSEKTAIAKAKRLLGS